MNVDDNYFEDVFDDEQPSEKKKLVEPIPALKGGWGRYGDYQIVGQDERTNGSCGVYVYPKGCLNVEAHSRVGIDGKSYVGKVHVTLVHNFCDKPSCKVCFKHGWAIRLADKVEHRLRVGSVTRGLVEHVILSIPTKDYGLDFKVLRSRVIKMLKGLGVVGGCLIFHGFRYSGDKGWYFSPHWHILGFILGGYSKCRNCPRKSNCDPNCGGFDARAWKNYLKTEYYCKVMGKRKTVFGSAWYQLTHASYRVSGKRHTVVTWFGSCSYRKLKVTVEMRKKVCPLCGDELVRLDYSGHVGFVTDRLSPDFKCSFLADYREDGVPVWSIHVEGVAVARSGYYASVAVPLVALRSL